MKKDFIKEVEKYLKSKNACTVHAIGIRDFAEFLNKKQKNK